MNPPQQPFDGFLAFGDESGSDGRLDPFTYILSAAIVDPEDLEEVREQAGELKMPGSRKAHWRDDSGKRHDTVIALIARMSIEGVIVARRGPPDEKPERRRRKCMEPFLTGIEEFGCTQLVLESRGPVDDKRDRTLLDTMRAKKQSEALRLDHRRGPEEPLLWIPDALCGAVTAARVGEQRWLKEISERIHITEIDHWPLA